MINESNLTVDELMNFGINYSLPVPLNINELECLFDNKYKRRVFHKRMEELGSDLAERFSLPIPVVQSFFNKGNIFSYESNSEEKSIYFNYHILISHLLKFFICKNKEETDEEHDFIFSILLNDADTVRVLTNKNIKEIRTKLNHMDNIKDIKDFISNHYYINEYYLKWTSLYNSIHLIEKIPKEIIFKEILCKDITDIIVQHKELVKFFYENSLNTEIFHDINKEKFLFYLAASTLNMCSQLKEVDPTVYYAINYYLHKTEENTPNIVIDIDRNYYSFIDFSKDLKEYLQKHPTIGMKRFKEDAFKGWTPEEVKECLTTLNEETLQNFSIINTEDVYIPNSENTGNERKKYEKHSRNTRKTVEEYNNLALTKKKFYISNKEQIYATLMGKNKFDGYIAHILKNGYVIFEKFDKTSGTISNQSGAAYIMTIDNFNEFSTRSIGEIREYVKQHPNGDINYKCHAGNWMPVLQKVIDKKTDINLSDVDKVLKKYSL